MRPYTLFLFFLLSSVNIASQELTGPDQIVSGTLASFAVVPHQEADWHIVEPSGVVLHHNAIHHVDTGRSRLYFASPVQGRYTIVAGIVIEGKPVIFVKTFINGAEAIPIPLPIPTLSAWVKSQLPVLVKSDNLDSESRLVAVCFDDIVRRIETENIRSVQNAQAQLQIALTGTLALASPTAVNDWAPFLTELSRRIEAEDLDEVKTVLRAISSAICDWEPPNRETLNREPPTTSAGRERRQSRRLSGILTINH